MWNNSPAPTVCMDVVETENNYAIHAELPGLNIDNLEVATSTYIFIY